MTSKLEIFQFYITQLNTHGRNEVKSNIFPLDIFKSDVIYFFVKKKFKIFQ